MSLKQVNTEQARFSPLFGGTFFNTSLLQKYIHWALEDMRYWYIQHFISDINME